MFLKGISKQVYNDLSGAKLLKVKLKELASCSQGETGSEHEFFCSFYFKVSIWIKSHVASTKICLKNNLKLVF